MLQSNHPTHIRIERAGADEDDAFTPADVIRALLGWPRRPRPERRPADDRGTQSDPK